MTTNVEKSIPEKKNENVMTESRGLKRTKVQLLDNSEFGQLSYAEVVKKKMEKE